jgi:hypothetical protein
MARRLLAFVERLLITALALLVAAVIVGLFARALRGPVVTSPVTGEVAAGEGAVAGGVEPAFPPATFVEGPCVDRPPEVDSRLTVIEVYFTCGNRAVPTGDTFVYRAVPEQDDQMAATLRELLQGPSPREQAQGFRSVFSLRTARSLETVSVTRGEAIVDFSELPDVVGLAAQEDAVFFVANLNANVFQYPAIDSIEYRLGGSCAAFWDHLGDAGGCRIIARENHEATMERNRPG